MDRKHPHQFPLVSGFPPARVLCVIGLYLILNNGVVHAQDCGAAEQYFDEANKLPWSLANEFKKEDLYRKAIAFCPAHGGAHNNLGDVYERQGRFADAISEYTESVRLTGEAVPYFGIADVYFKTNRPKDALEWYEKGLKIDPNDKMSAERAGICRDLLKSPVVSAETIRAVLSPANTLTRGPAEVVSIAFGESLIPFDFDSATIVPPASAQLDEIGKALKTIPRTVVQVSGHTDARGADAYNLGLSDRRARSVVAYLEANFGILRERLPAKGYGERVPVCTVDGSEACHALNRRVELVRGVQPVAAPDAAPLTTGASEGTGVPPAIGGRPGSTPEPGVVHVPTRGVEEAIGFRDSPEPDIGLETGFFHQNQSGRIVPLREDSRLRTESDRYFLFFRPHQDCYVYVIQQDSRGKVDLLFPSDVRDASVQRDKDYWVPGFGSAFSLDQSVGDETLYLVATSWPLESDLQGALLADRVHKAIPGLTRSPIVKAVPPLPPESISAAELAETPRRLDALLESVRGRGGWVDVVTFKHE